MARAVDPALKAEAYRLRAEGRSYRDIARRTGISKGTLAYWFSEGQQAKTRERSKEWKRRKRRADGALTKEEYNRKRREEAASRPKPEPKPRKPREAKPRKPRKKREPKSEPRGPKALSLDRQQSIEERIRERLGR